MYVQAVIHGQLGDEFGIQAGDTSDLQNDMKSVRYILAYIERAYRDLLQSGDWDECLQKMPGKSSFLADDAASKQTTKFNRDSSGSTGKETCFNCGSKDHSLANCPHPIDQELVKSQSQSSLFLASAQVEITGTS